MKIRILGTESFGVRGLCCFISLKNKKVLIDPGIALGWNRHGLLPHPFQVAVGAQIRTKIIKAIDNATDVIFSHYDGDHIPLSNANPYQLDLNDVKASLTKCKIWSKGAESTSKLENQRRQALEKALNRELSQVDGQFVDNFCFSNPMPHGLRNRKAVSIMMTRIEEDGEVFVHASDHQFLSEESIDQIITWHPDIVFTSGPPFYLSILSSDQRKMAKRNAIKLSQHVKIMIVDHHLLREEAGLTWLEEIATASGNQVVCAAEFMKQQPLLLEAWRGKLYEWITVPEGWHDAYVPGKVDLSTYLKKGWDVLTRKGRTIPPRFSE
ncbi:MAG: hypothetical protein U9R53_06235 [Chloroflexota bacterium]|nr:hypothetical protein [Chloroflexota bacterium]